MKSGLGDAILDMKNESNYYSSLRMSSCMMINKTYDEYIYLRENIGMIPTSDEFDLLVTEMSRFYKAHSDKTIMKHNDDCVNEDRQPVRYETPPKNEDKSGYIYLIKSTSGHYKIGQSKNPKRRLKELQKGATIGPFELDLVCYFKVKDMDDIEDHLHGYFYAERVIGEWFNLSNDQVKEFEKEVREVLQHV